MCVRYLDLWTSDRICNPPYLDRNVLAAYTIVRGSIPLVWIQSANLKYTPEIHFLSDKSSQERALKLHFDDLHERYGQPIVSINLCKEKGQEKRLSDAYEAFFHRATLKGTARYVMFDFHKETKGLKYSKVHNLLEQLEDSLQETRYVYLFLQLCATGMTDEGILKSQIPRGDYWKFDAES